MVLVHAQRLVLPLSLYFSQRCPRMHPQEAAEMMAAANLTAQKADAALQLVREERQVSHDDADGYEEDPH